MRNELLQSFKQWWQVNKHFFGIAKEQKVLVPK
jgi:hypothetical protein